MSYSRLALLNGFLQHPEIRLLATAANIPLPFTERSLSVEQFNALLSAYCTTLLRKTQPRMYAEQPAADHHYILTLDALIKKLEHQAGRVSTDFSPLLASAASHSVDSKQAYNQQLSLRLSAYKKALDSYNLTKYTQPDDKLFGAVIICAFNIRYFVENETCDSVRRLSISTKLNPFSKKQQSTTASLGDEAKDLVNTYFGLFNSLIPPETSPLTASEAFYQLWLITHPVGHFNIIASNVLLNYLSPRLLLKHFLIDTPQLMTESFVNKKYVTCAPLVIDYDASFPDKAGAFNARVVGCHGVSTCLKKEVQREIGAWEAVVAAISKTKQSDDLFSLGDAAYEYGATSFHQIDNELAAYLKLNQWFCWGNHEYGLCSGGPKHKAIVVPAIAALYEKDNHHLCGFQRGLLFWLRSYLPKDASRIQNEEIKVKDMSNLHAAYRYYAVAFKTAKMLMIVLDSNLFPFDVPQQKWLCELLLDARYATYKKLWVMHHPFIDPGKRGVRDKVAELELIRYQEFIQCWFAGLPEVEYDPRKSQMWVQNQQTVLAYLPRDYPTIGCFIADFLVKNQLCHLLNNAVVFSAHFHGHMEYELRLDDVARIWQIILGAGGAQSEEAKSLQRNTTIATFNGVTLKDPAKWAKFKMTDFKLISHGGMDIFDFADLEIVSGSSYCEIQLLRSVTTAQKLPIILRPPEQRIYRL